MGEANVSCVKIYLLIMCFSDILCSMISVYPSSVIESILKMPYCKKA